MRALTLLIVAVALVANLPAQSKDLTEQAQATDRTMNDMFNRQDPSAALQAGGAFFVSNPALPVDIDVDRAYFSAEWQELVFRMVDGNTATVQGRYRLVDQKFEVKQDDGIYEMRNTVLREVQLGEDYFVMLPFENEMTIFQAHYRDSTYAVLTHHYTEWQDPPEQKLYDTSERKRTLKRKEKRYLQTPGQVMEADKKAEVNNVLHIFKGSPLYGYVRSQKLDVRDTDDLVKLLRYMADNGLGNHYSND